MSRTSDEEDEDLELLRSAALASLRRKRNVQNQNDDTDDLEALRNVALTSRKSREDEDTIFEKLQPTRSSNLINLTPGPEAELDLPKEEKVKAPLTEESSGKSDSESEKSHASDSLPRNDSESSRDVDSNDECDKESSAKEEEQEGHSTKEETAPPEPKEEVDLLDAIDQFLDEGVMMLEEAITPEKPKPEPKKNSKTKPSKPKTAKKEKIKETVAKEKSVSKENRTSKKQKQKIVDEKPIRKDQPRANKKSKTTSSDSMTSNSQVPDTDKLPRSEPNLWKSDDLPLRVDAGIRKKRRHRVEVESVHSSDLSFLSDSSSESKPKDGKISPQPVNNQKRKADREYIRVDRKKLDQFRNEAQHTRSENSPVSGRNAILPLSDDNNVGRRRRYVDKPYPDLREKLQQRGLHRRAKPPEETFRNTPAVATQVEKGENEASRIQIKKKNKIYMKPSMSQESKNGAISTDYDSKRLESKKKKSSRLIVTRDITENKFSALKVRIADKDEQKKDKSKPPNSFRRKRSVVQFKPELSAAEKEKRLEEIKKQAEKEKREENTFSDLGEDFDDFEIDEPDENTIVETAIKPPPEKKHEEKSDTRRFVATTRVESSSDESALSDGEIVDEPAKMKSSVHQRLGKPTRVTDVIKKKTRRRSDEEYGPDVPPDRRHRRHFRNNDDIDEDFVTTKRNANFSGPLRSGYSRTERSHDRVRRHSLSPPEERTFKQRRRVGTVIERMPEFQNPDDLERSGSGKPVRHRLGYNRDVSPHSERRTYSSERFRERRKAVEDHRVERGDREKDVDAKIRWISKQNAAIMKRRRLIEIEEKKFRMKLT